MAAPGNASLRDYGLAAPHGPNMTGQHVATQDVDFRQDMSENESSVFHSLLHPDDMYTADGTYWADLPLAQRFKFVTSVDAKETKEEFRYFWAMFRKDPLEPMRHYFRTCVIPGAGLGLEGLVLITLGKTTTAANVHAVTFFSPLATSSLFSKQHFQVVGANSRPATRPGPRPLST